MLRRILIVTVALLVGVVPSVNSQTSATEPAPAPTSSTQPKASGIAPYADQLLNKACQVLASADAFSFHAETMFDQVLPPDVKLQFAGAMDFAVQEPGELAIDYHSDLGAKELWCNSGTLTILDSPHMVYSTLTVPATIEGCWIALKQINLTIPLSDFAVNDPCQLVRKQVTYGGFVGMGDVKGVEYDHVAPSSPTTDWQVWLDRSGKTIPRKVVINYRSLPGSPEYIAFLSDWKVPKAIPASHFRPDLPRDVKKIGFVEVKEAKP